MRILIPIHTVSEPNLREHWRKRANRTRNQRTATRAIVHAQLYREKIVTGKKPLIISLTRIAPRALDSDNLAGSFKAVRDGIADALGTDDGSPLLEWRYGQEKGGPRQYAVCIEITTKYYYVPNDDETTQ